MQVKKKKIENLFSVLSGYFFANKSLILKLRNNAENYRCI